MKRIALIAAALALAVPNAHALTAQQEKMKACNADAAAKSLKGDERKGFMKECLSAHSAKPSALTPQQEKMKTCNADPKAKSLKGADRRAFLKACLSAKPAEATAPAATPAPLVPASPPAQ